MIFFFGPKWLFLGLPRKHKITKKVVFPLSDAKHTLLQCESTPKNLSDKVLCFAVTQILQELFQFESQKKECFLKISVHRCQFWPNQLTNTFKAIIPVSHPEDETFS